jgi:hypothetical protein
MNIVCLSTYLDFLRLTLSMIFQFSNLISLNLSLGFHALDTNGNGVHFLFQFQFLLLLYRNTIIFFILALYPAGLLNSLIILGF